MLNMIFLILGIFLLLIVFIDIFTTALWVDKGAGFLTDWISSATYALFMKMSTGKSSISSVAGPVILLLTLLVWTLLLWSGWLLVFAGNEQTIVDTRDNLPISWAERVYFTGFVVFTLGIGDYVPNGDLWQVLTAVAAGSGFLFITLGVTYVLNVLSAVIQQRSFATTITGLGMTGKEIVQSSWDGEDFHDIDLFLNSISSELSDLAAQHKAYPILHYYHSPVVEKSSPLAVAIFDEALTILKFGIQKEQQPNRLEIKKARSSVMNYLEALDKKFTANEEDAPPLFSLQSLRNSGIPVKDDSQFEEEVKQLAKRRVKLLSVVTSSHQQWPSDKKDE